MFICYYFYSKLSDKKMTPFFCILVGTLLFSVNFAVNTIFSNSIWLNGIFFLISHTLFAIFCFKIKGFKAIFYSVLLCIFSTAIEFATIFIFSGIMSVEVNAYQSNILILITEGGVSKALYFLICLILANFVLKKDSSDVRIPLSLYMYPVSAIISLVVFWYISFDNDLSAESQQLLAIISLILLYTSVTIFLLYQRNIERENEYILLKNEIAKIEIQKNYYDILEHQNQELLLYAHDAKNHLAIIKSLNENPKIEEYIKKMTDRLTSYSNVSHSGNMILDVIINRYIAECSLKNIKFSFDIRLNNLLFVDDIDLVTILDNLLDNALEAAEKTKEKKVVFETDHRNSYEVIIITNSCVDNPIKNDKLITTKPDKRHHGFGLKSVKKALKKYDGDISLEYVEGKKEFITTAMIHNNSISFAEK